VSSSRCWLPQPMSPPVGDRRTASLVLTGISSLVTNNPVHGGLLGTIGGAAVAIVDGVVSWVGSADSIPGEYGDIELVDVEGRAVLPGFVDAHTHAVFAGDRADEFTQRAAGATYEEILAGGGGIHATVAATRAATLDELVAASTPRIERMLQHGTTTAEVKTGYGLDVESERKILDAILAIDRHLPIDLIPTYLGAHVVPQEFVDMREAYLDRVTGEMLDAVASDVRFVDVFCDDAAFTVAETRRVASAASAVGLPMRLHVDQLSASGGAALAAELGVVSADHLDHASDEDFHHLADAGIVAVLLPGVSWSLRLPAPPGRRAWDAGVTVAIATDCNPGTSYVETMPFVIALAVATTGLTVDEAVWAATRGGALSLDLPDRGAIEVGSVGDLVIVDADTHAHLAYRPDGGLVAATVKRGIIL
jgi:imidazolonepropionase